MPTPVSALIHAATLVTAGVYLMVRLGPFWDDLVILVGCLTAFMAGVFGFFQADIKRVIAFSTCSQLGYPTFPSVVVDQQKIVLFSDAAVKPLFSAAALLISEMSRWVCSAALIFNSRKTSLLLLNMAHLYLNRD